jgi:hypothetical protein
MPACGNCSKHFTLPESKTLRKQLVGKVRDVRHAHRDAHRLLTEAKAEVERLIEGT